MRIKKVKAKYRYNWKSGRWDPVPSLDPVTLKDRMKRALTRAEVQREANSALFETVKKLWP
jgi:hypothetical protein